VEGLVWCCHSSKSRHRSETASRVGGARLYVFVPKGTTTGAHMQVGDLVKKTDRRLTRNGWLYGVVVQVDYRGSEERQLVNFGDYGTFWQVPGMVELLS